MERVGVFGVNGLSALKEAVRAFWSTHGKVWIDWGLVFALFAGFEEGVGGFGRGFDHLSINVRKHRMKRMSLM